MSDFPDEDIDNEMDIISALDLNSDEDPMFDFEEDE